MIPYCNMISRLKHPALRLRAGTAGHVKVTLGTYRQHRALAHANFRDTAFLYPGHRVCDGGSQHGSTGQRGTLDHVRRRRPGNRLAGRPVVFQAGCAPDAGTALSCHRGHGGRGPDDPRRCGQPDLPVCRPDARRCPARHRAGHARPGRLYPAGVCAGHQRPCAFARSWADAGRRTRRCRRARTRSGRSIPNCA
jgi:hypothetical protein